MNAIQSHEAITLKYVGMYLNSSHFYKPNVLNNSFKIYVCFDSKKTTDK